MRMASVGNDTPGPGPELIVVAHPEAGLEVRGTSVQAAAADAAPLERALVETGADAHPLFGRSEAHVRERRDESPWDLPDLSHYYRVRVDTDHEAVAARLNEEETVAGAYVKEPVRVDEDVLPTSTLADPGAFLTAASPDLGSGQLHLDPPPGGVNARAAWTKPGGDGTGAKVAIVGGAWRRTHEDLGGSVGEPIRGTQIDAISFRNHGTAMLGLVRATSNASGVTGVAPACQVTLVATFGLGTAAAIRAAADALPAGGVLLIEWQRPGPGSTGVGAAGFLPLEWWPDDFAAILYATTKGVIVVEPAGNGSVSLDAALYDTPAPGFPAAWKNPFKRSLADCGSILVGAGAPPPGTHGHDRGPDRSRLAFSNVGASVDVQGWGAELTTLGYGDLQGGPNEDLWYTSAFGGTSGAAALVAGVVASLQGMELAGGKRPPLTPAGVRQFLHQTGSPQQDGPNAPVTSSRIGTRPDLIALMGLLAQTKDESKDTKDGKDNKDNKESKDNKDNKEAPDKIDKDNKDNKDDKENKEEKEDKDHKDSHIEKLTQVEKDPPEQPPFAPPDGLAHGSTGPAAAVSDAPVRHFIPSESRPDLSRSHLSHEPDFRRG
jgi:hypothetical protein